MDTLYHSIKNDLICIILIIIILTEFQREEQRRMQEQMQMAHIPDPAWGNNCKDEVESVVMSMDGSILPGAVEYQKHR